MVDEVIDGSGLAAMAAETLAPGRYVVEGRYPGDLDTRPASAFVEIDVLPEG